METDDKKGCAFVENLIINGGCKLSGEIDIQGAKNSALPILAATVLIKGECIIHNCPSLTDIDAAIKILEYLGCSVTKDGHTVCVNASGMSKSDIPEILMHEMRSSIIFLAPILARCNEAELYTPGGCEIGVRPIDLHLYALRKMGAEITEEHGKLICKCEKGLKGENINLSFPSVGATENIIIAASLAKGTTVITNAAREPEIIDLADFLNSCGAEIKGAGESTVVITGKKNLCGCEHTVIPDRIMEATYLSAAAITGGSIELNNADATLISSVIPLFELAGCKIRYDDSRISISSPERLSGISTVRTMPYPGFPTDAQAPVMAMSTLANSTSVFVENIFESRFKHVSELCVMGAKIKVEGRVAIVEGVKKLSGANVKAPDLRGGAALVIAALAAEGETKISDIYHIDRGCENFEENLRRLGAVISRKEI